MCKIMASMAVIIGVRAIVLHTFRGLGSSFHFVFHYPNRTPIYCSSFRIYFWGLGTL